jgi:hypothetical protein
MSLFRAMRFRVGLNPIVAVLRGTADRDNVAMTSVEQVRRQFFVFLLGTVWALAVWAPSVTARQDTQTIRTPAPPTVPPLPTTSSSTTTTLPSAVTTVPQGCALPPQALAVFVGEIISTDPVSAVFSVLQIRAGSLEGYQEGTTVQVRYGSDAKFLSVGDSYLVGVAPDPVSSRLSSSIRDSAELFGGAEIAGSNTQCPEFEQPARTFTLEGRDIEAGLFSQFFDQPLRLALAVVLPPLLVVLALFGLVWFRRGMAT